MLSNREINTVWFWSVSSTVRGRVSLRRPLTCQDALMQIRIVAEEAVFCSDRLYARTQELLNEVIYDTIGEKKIPEPAKVIPLQTKRAECA